MSELAEKNKQDLAQLRAEIAALKGEPQPSVTAQQQPPAAPAGNPDIVTKFHNDGSIEAIQRQETGGPDYYSNMRIDRKSRTIYYNE